MTVIVYTLLSILPGPFILQVVLVSAFGPLLAAASLGLYHVLVATGNTILLQLAVMFNILGASIFTMMGLVQLAIRFKLLTVGENTLIPPALPATLVGVQLGMDVAWDIFIGLGTLLFALNMIRDPRFGWIPGLFGILIALGLIVLNLLTFPIPPAEKNLIDLGPFVGLWYLAVTILVIKWLLG
jgi:hypothetical protein